MKSITNPFRRDFVDVTREFLANLFAEMNAILRASLDRSIHYGKKYLVMHDADVSGNDIKRVGDCGEGHAEPCDPEVLKTFCNETPECVGFNMNGYLKNNMEDKIPYGIK